MKLVQITSNFFITLLLLNVTVNSVVADEAISVDKKFPYIFHLIQAEYWDAAKADNSVYFPPTYDADGFTHGTANPEKLLVVANHFYKDVKGEWYCLRMTLESLQGTGVETRFEGTAPVGDKQPDFEGSQDELFPHILGGIAPRAVLVEHPVIRSEDGTFLSIKGLYDE